MKMGIILPTLCMRTKLLPLLSFLLTTYAIHATVVEPPSAFLRRYNITDYHASSQNWDLVVSPQGILYVANNSGLLTFDGNTWTTYELPDKSTVYQVTLSGDSIYTRSEYSYGYWLYNNLNRLVYYPVEKLPEHIKFRNHAEEVPANLPDDIIKQRPSTFVTINDLHFIGTLSNGIYITDIEGHILLHLSTRIGLQDNIVYALYVDEQSQTIWGAFDNGMIRISLNPAFRLLATRSRVGKLIDAAYHDSIIYIKTNTNYYSRTLQAGDFFHLADEEKAKQYLKEDENYTNLKITDVIKNEKILSYFHDIEYVYPVSESLYWFTKSNEAALFLIEGNNIFLKCRVLFNNEYMNLVIRGRQFIPLNDTLHLAATMQGVLLINTNQMIRNESDRGLPFRFTRIEYKDGTGFHSISPTSKKISLPHNYQEIIVHAGSSVFNTINQISYKIDQISSDWSEWQLNGKISLLQLPEGKYTMRVRSYVPKGDLPEISLLIEVKSPWYYSTFAIVIYAVLLWIILRIGLNSYLKKQKQNEEQRMQQLKNDMLETELQNKKNELMLQTTNLVRKSNLIHTLLNELEHQKNSLGERYPNKMYNRMRSLIENTLDDKNDWVAFESYFNSAHQNFIKRFSQQYTDITPGDIRMCCLLRMNLSTKEIASLLHVSVRAVELRRYRLRKRIGLESDTNLVEFLINF